ncbi:MAG: hypothetical protein JOZ34_07520 [Gammaproteobacteria bacterium]|nr:hypothetical protein [Gammaproteobacteria bacterium]MBV9726117.1 hypothetical protein [Gammaproteobacteria bacterium]
MSKRAPLTWLMVLIAGVALADTAKPPGQWVETLTHEALDSGFLSRLPPNVSVVFGLAKAKDGTDVRQLLAKEGHQVRTFNVSVANHNDVVIFNVNAQSGATVAYLVGPDGQLRKAVSYQTGGEAQDLSPADAKAGMAREKKYWATRAKSGQHASSAPAAAPKSGSAQ